MEALKRYVAWYLVAAMFVIGIAPRSEAGFAPSGEIALAQADRASDMQKVRSVLETKMVRDRLEKLGYTQEEIQSRLSRLSDQQIHELALNLDQIKAGGGWPRRRHRHPRHHPSYRPDSEPHRAPGSGAVGSPGLR